MDATIGFFTGAWVMWAISMRLKSDLMKEIEKLKDFDTWKEWKNR